MKRFIFLGFIFAASCMMGHRVMTINGFSDISLGMSAEQVEKQAGTPYDVHDLGEGRMEFEYIERIKMGTQDIEERHYYILFKNDRVSGKRMKEISPPPFRTNSLDLQTSQNDF